MDIKYDRKLDQYFYFKSWENYWTRLTISIISYNKGREKLQITRRNINTASELKLVNLAGLTKEEIENSLPLIQEALKLME